MDGDGRKRTEMAFWLTKVMTMNLNEGNMEVKDPFFGVEVCNNEKN